MWPSQVLPLLVKVDLGVIPVNEPRIQMQFSDIPKTILSSEFMPLYREYSQRILGLVVGAMDQCPVKYLVSRIFNKESTESCCNKLQMILSYTVSWVTLS